MVTSTGNVIETPTPDDLVVWKGLNSVTDFDVPFETVQLFLQLSNDLLQLATGITSAPDPNSPLGRIVKYGILDMAWYIGTSLEDRDAEFSPFSSERIGSYSYSKASKQIQAGLETGVPFFDMAVRYLSEQHDASHNIGLGSDAEKVFPEPRSRYVSEVEHLGPHAAPWDDDIRVSKPRG